MMTQAPEAMCAQSVLAAATLGAQLSRSDVERSTFYDLLPLQGVEPGRVVQTITALEAEQPTARRLRPTGSCRPGDRALRKS